jgi:vacuolar-type H+-ATPase subunit I/STV1
LKLIIDPQYEALHKKYTALKNQISIVIEDRAELVHHKAVALKTEYIMKIGRLEYELFEIECNIARTRRKIDMIQACINLQVPINEEQIEQQLDKEYEEYIEKLKQMASDIDVANYLDNCEKLTVEETAELKKTYRAIIKLIHPDVNDNLTEEQKALWNRVNDAYETGNIEMLKVLYELVLDNETIENTENTDDENEIDVLKTKVEFLQKKIKDLLQDIEKIKKAFPFNIVDFLKDEEKIHNKQEELHKSIKEAERVLEELNTYLLMLKPTNGEYNN